MYTRQSVASESSLGRDQLEYSASYQETPPKMSVLFTVMFTVCSTFLSSTIVSPYIPFIVEEFNPNLQKTNLGTKSGILGAVFYAGLICGGFGWNTLTLKFGRRPVLVAGLVLSGTFALGFGFSKSYWLAVALRLLWGVSNSYISIAKRVLSEVTDASNGAYAVLVFSVGSIVGKMLGYAVGGLLACPADKYDWLQYSFFKSYPYALPVFFAAGFNLFSAILVVCFLPKSHHNKMQSMKAMGGNTQISPVQNTNQPLLSDSETEMPDISIFNIFISRRVACTILPVLLTTMSHASFNTVFPLWVLLPTENRGFAFTSSDIGLARVLAFPTDLFLELTLYSKLVQKFGLLGCYRLSSLLWVITLAVTPFAYMTNKAGTRSIWMTIYFVVVMNNAWGCVVLWSNGSMSANSTEGELRGRVLRVRQILIGLGGAFGSIFGGMIFSWGLSSDARSGYLKKFPFDYYCVWVCMAILTFILIIFSACLPTSIEFTPEEWEQRQEWKRINSRRSLSMSIDESFVSHKYKTSNADRNSVRSWK